MRRETHVFAGTIKLVGSVKDTIDRIDPVDTEADADVACETPPTIIVVVEVGSRPELGTRLKVIVVGLLLPVTQKSMEVILTSLLTFPLIVTAAALYALLAVAEDIICEPNIVPELHVSIELSKVCCPYTTSNVNK
jgi:hypothetical protein